MYIRKKICCQVKTLWDLPFSHRWIYWILQWSPTQLKAKEVLYGVCYTNQNGPDPGPQNSPCLDTFSLSKKNISEFPNQESCLRISREETRQKKLHLPDGERWSSNTLATWCVEPTHWKKPWCWGRLRAGGEGSDRGWDNWKASPTQWTWVWANSRR